MKSLCMYLLLAISTVTVAQNKYEIPENELTEQQKERYVPKGNLPSPQEAHQWVGIGKEIGEAVNGSLSAITTQTNTFAQTPVGKFTAFIVLWKVVGTEFYHLIIGLIEIIVFVPLFIWSYRKTCMSRRLVLSVDGPWYAKKKTYQYDKYVYEENAFTPRIAHGLVLVGFTAVLLFTVFTG